MLTFQQDYATAMAAKAPREYAYLRKTGALEAHLNKKEKEAREMFAAVTEGLPTLPSGALANPQDESEAREKVYAALMEFAPTTPEAETTLDAETPPIQS